MPKWNFLRTLLLKTTDQPASCQPPSSSQSCREDSSVDVSRPSYHRSKSSISATLVTGTEEWLCAGAPADSAVEGLTQVNSFGETVFHACAARIAGAALLAQLCDVAAQHWGPLVSWLKAHKSHEAAGERLTGPEEVLAALLDLPDSQGFTALYTAAAFGHAHVVSMLLRKGSNPWLGDSRCGHTPLHIACLKGHTLACSVLLCELPHQWLLNPTDQVTRLANARTKGGFTPLHCAVAGNDINTVRALLVAHPWMTLENDGTFAESKLQYPVGSTPLHLVSVTGNLEVARAMLRYFMEQARSKSLLDPRTLTDSAGKLPWRIAYEKGFRPLARLLHPSANLRVEFDLDKERSLSNASNFLLTPIGETQPVVEQDHEETEAERASQFFFPGDATRSCLPDSALDPGSQSGSRRGSSEHSWLLSGLATLAPVHLPGAKRHNIHGRASGGLSAALNAASMSASRFGPTSLPNLSRSSSDGGVGGEEDSYGLTVPMTTSRRRTSQQFGGLSVDGSVPMSRFERLSASSELRAAFPCRASYATPSPPP